MGAFRDIYLAWVHKASTSTKQLSLLQTLQTNTLQGRAGEYLESKTE